MNRVYKLTPVSMYDVAGLEKWLEKLAAQGLFLKKYRPLVCTFEKGEPRRVRYRLEPYPCSLAADFPDDMVELFRECGWEHVGAVNREMLIFSSADPHAPEPHTDPDIRLEQWNKLYLRARKDLRAYLLIDLFALLAIAAWLLWGGTPLTKLLGVDFYTLYFPIILFFQFIPQSLASLAKYRELAAVIRELEGKRPKHRLWFPSRQFFSWATILWLVLLLSLIPLAQHLDTLEYPVTEFPPLYITDPESGRVLGSDLARPGFSPLCPRQRRTFDFDSSGERIRHLEVYWFDLPDWLSFLAVPSARDLLASSMKLNSRYYPWRVKEPVYWVTRDCPGAGADWLSVADSEDGAYHTAAAALGDKVVLVQYIGSGNLTEYLDDIAAMVR